MVEGRHTWHYLETDEEMEEWPQSNVDKFHLGLLSDRDVPTHSTPPATPLEGIQRGFEFYKLLQTEDGHWAGEDGGPLFLLPGKYTASKQTRAQKVLNEFFLLLLSFQVSSSAAM